MATIVHEVIETRRKSAAIDKPKNPPNRKNSAMEKG